MSHSTTTTARLTTLNIIISKRLYLALGLAFYLFASSPALVASPGISLIPPTNHRPGKADTFGVQVEFFLRNNLKKTGFVDVTSFEVVRQLAGAPPHTYSRYRLDGHYQQVGRLIFLSINLVKPDGSLGKWEQTFNRKKTLDHLEALGHWVLKEMGLKAPWPGWSLGAVEGKLLYQLRLQRFETDKLPRLEQARELFRDFGSSESEPVIAEVALDLLLSAQADMEKGASLLKRTDRYLRRALIKHPKSGDLLTMLALDYHLSHSYPSFVEKTSVEALTTSPDNELAWLLASLSTGLSSGLGRERLQRFVALHPLAWNPRLKYLSGALEQELTKAALVLKRLKHPDPFKLRNP